MELRNFILSKLAILVFLAGAFGMSPSITPQTGYVDSVLCLSNCTTVFTPDPAWSSNYPSCTVTTSVEDCESDPIVTLTGDCYLDEGTVNVGAVDVYDGVTLITSYQVKVEDGIIILIEDL